MDKSCDNCYWKVYKDMFCIKKTEKPKENICDYHNFMCECEEKADYKYKEKHYCSDCILKEFDVEESKTTHYQLHGEYLGSDDDFDEVICNLNDGIESIS